MSAKMFEDQVVIVTGGGRGIGAAACRMFADHGAKVVVSDRDEEPTESNVQAIKDAGGEAIGVAGDVTDAAFPDKLMNAAIEAYGKWKQGPKTVSTFIDGFLEHLRPDGRFHPTYFLGKQEWEGEDAGTTTGRS